MKLISAIIKPFKLDDVRAALPDGAADEALRHLAGAVLQSRAKANPKIKLIWNTV